MLILEKLWKNDTSNDTYYYEILSEMIGEEITGEYQLISILKEFANKKDVKQMNWTLDLLSVIMYNRHMEVKQR